MKMRIVKENPLFWAGMWPAMVDGIVTLAGQSREYWAGNYSLVNEGSPAWRVLAIHPGLFVLGGISWFAVWYLIFKRLKPPVNIMLAVGFAAGHAYGAGSWFSSLMSRAGWYAGNVRFGWYLLVVYFVLIGLVSGWLIHRYYLSRKN